MYLNSAHLAGMGILTVAWVLALGFSGDDVFIPQGLAFGGILLILIGYVDDYRNRR